MTAITADYRYVGPMSLSEALLAAEPKGGIALAISVPDGTLVAVSVARKVRVRRVTAVSGRLGSIAGTGRWMDPAEVPPSVSWRSL